MSGGVCADFSRTCEGVRARAFGAVGKRQDGVSLRGSGASAGLYRRYREIFSVYPGVVSEIDSRKRPKKLRRSYK